MFKKSLLVGITAVALATCSLPVIALGEIDSSSSLISGDSIVSVKKCYEIKSTRDLAILEKEWESFIIAHPNSSEAEQEAYLLSFVNKGNLENYEKSIGDYLPGYGNLNSAERKLALAHPIQAIKVYNAGNTATNKTIQVYGNNGWQDNSDAFRHCLWNALMKKSIGASAAYEWATAHEYGSSGLDKTMDLWNNSIGRSIGVSGKSDDQIVELVKSRVRNGSCRRIVNNTLVKTTGAGMK